MDPREAGKRGGKATRGERKGTAKLSESEVRSILTSSEPSRLIAPRFNVSDGHVRHIRSGKWWRHINADSKAG